MVIVRDTPQQGKLVPTLGLFSTIMLIMGSMIGSGIFRLPSSMMAYVQDPGILILVWVVGGIFTIFGALTFAELAGMFPQAGGQYVFLRESMGKKWAFLYGWTFFWVVMTGIIAAVAVIFAKFVQILFGADLVGEPWLPIIAVACIMLLTLVNYLGARFGGLVQNIFTVAKFAALIALVVFGFALGSPDHSTFSQSVASAPTGGLLFVAFVLAMTQGFFALDGWPQAAYVAAEIKNPTRNIPRAMILGVSLVAVVYVLATWTYTYLLSVPEIMSIFANRQVISAEAMRAIGGDTAARLIAAAVIVSTFGTVNAYVLTSPRIFYALAKDGLFWSPFQKIHPKWNTPSSSLIFQGIWASYIVILGSISPDAYTVIVEAVVFGIWLFYIPTVFGYFKLRRERPDIPRPYRTHAYPVVPILFGVAAVIVVGTLLVNHTYGLFTGEDLFGRPIGVSELSGLWGSLLVLTGVPFLFRIRALQASHKKAAEA